MACINIPSTWFCLFFTYQISLKITLKAWKHQKNMETLEVHLFHSSSKTGKQKQNPIGQGTPLGLPAMWASGARKKSWGPICSKQIPGVPRLDAFCWVFSTYLHLKAGPAWRTVQKLWMAVLLETPFSFHVLDTQVVDPSDSIYDLIGLSPDHPKTARLDQKPPQKNIGKL